MRVAELRDDFAAHRVLQRRDRDRQRIQPFVDERVGERVEHGRVRGLPVRAIEQDRDDGRAGRPARPPVVDARAVARRVTARRPAAGAAIRVRRRSPACGRRCCAAAPRRCARRLHAGSATTTGWVGRDGALRDEVRVFLQVAREHRERLPALRRERHGLLDPVRPVRLAAEMIDHDRPRVLQHVVYIEVDRRRLPQERDVREPHARKAGRQMRHDAREQRQRRVGRLRITMSAGCWSIRTTPCVSSTKPPGVVRSRCIVRYACCGSAAHAASNARCSAAASRSSPISTKRLARVRRLASDGRNSCRSGGRRWITSRIGAPGSAAKPLRGRSCALRRRAAARRSSLHACRRHPTRPPSRNRRDGDRDRRRRPSRDGRDAGGSFLPTPIRGRAASRDPARRASRDLHLRRDFFANRGFDLRELGVADEIGLVHDHEVGGRQLIGEQLVQRRFVVEVRIGAALRVDGLRVFRELAARGRRPVDHGHDRVDREAVADRRPVERLHERLRQRRPTSRSVRGRCPRGARRALPSPDRTLPVRCSWAAVREFVQLARRFALRAVGILAADAAALEISPSMPETAEFVDDHRDAAAFSVLQDVAHQRRLAAAESP